MAEIFRRVSSNPLTHERFTHDLAGDTRIKKVSRKMISPCESSKEETTFQLLGDLNWPCQIRCELSFSMPFLISYRRPSLKFIIQVRIVAQFRPARGATEFAETHYCIPNILSRLHPSPRHLSLIVTIRLRGGLHVRRDSCAGSQK